MLSKMTKQTLARRRGYWFTTEKGQHLFAKEGETPKEACERYYAEREAKAEKIEALQRKVEGRMVEPTEPVETTEPAKPTEVAEPEETVETEETPEPEDATEAEETTQSDVDRLYGEEFKGYKGQAAIEKLLKEQHGHVKGAFHRDDMGDIDLVWGTDTAGLQHIISRRLTQGVDVSAFLQSLSEVIETGKVRRKTSRGDFEVMHEGNIAVLATSYHDSKIQFLLTAYKTRYK